MPNLAHLTGFALLALGLALTPGPNMAYLVSRSICQGRRAGIVSLAGVAVGFVFYMLCAAFGITALLLAVPYAYDALRFGGAAYLLFLAWQVVRPGGRSPFQTRGLQPVSARRLFAAGLATNLLNPKIALFYLSLLPQFIDPANGGILRQSVVLGLLYIVISVSVNGTLVLTAGLVAAFLSERPAWLAAQRWLMGTVLAGMALRIAADRR